MTAARLRDSSSLTAISDSTTVRSALDRALARCSRGRLPPTQPDREALCERVLLLGVGNGGVPANGVDVSWAADCAELFDGQRESLAGFLPMAIHVGCLPLGAAIQEH